MLFSPHLKLGDGLVLLLGGLLTVWLATQFWASSAADKVIIRSGGKIFQEIALSQNIEIPVSGPLGTSVIAIRDRQARIASDPSPRQYCVRQGWLKNAGEMAICLPNQISIELVGSQKKYDSLNY